MFLGIEGKNMNRDSEKGGKREGIKKKEKS
jgi:hypothetical protein